MKVKEQSEKVGLKLNIQKTTIMASGPITSWQIDGEIVETVADFISGGSKATADGDCTHKINIMLPNLGRFIGYSRSVLRNGATLNTSFPPVFGGTFGPGRIGRSSIHCEKSECFGPMPFCSRNSGLPSHLPTPTPLSKSSLTAQARVDNRTIKPLDP